MSQDLLGDVVHPITKEAVTIEGSVIKDKDGKQVGRFSDDYSPRLDWISDLKYGSLDDAIIKEIKAYDSWARKHLKGMSSFEEDKNLKIEDVLSAALYDNSEIRKVDDFHEQLKGAKLLDIGGSFKDAWRFMAGDLAELHHIEVSGGCQDLAKERIADKVGTKFLDKLVFQTVPAEYLPYKDNTFDMIFSRSTIHHTLREYAIPEIYRVLKPGGKFIQLEPLRSKLFKGLIKFERAVRRVDRGSDDPLTAKDLKIMTDAGFKILWKPDSLIGKDFEVASQWVKLKKAEKLEKVSLIYAEK